jgi:hypothetical protein
MIYLLPRQFDCFRCLSADEVSERLVRMFPWLPVAQLLFFFGGPVILVPTTQVIVRTLTGCESFYCGTVFALVLMLFSYLVFLNFFLYPKACKHSRG